MMHLSFLSLSYHKDLGPQYANLRDLPGFVLLESPDRLKDSYDIVSALPFDRLTVHHTAHSPETLIEAIYARAPGFLNQKSSSTLPFQSGAIGFFSYDLACAFKGLDLRPPPGLAAVPMVDLGFYDWAIVVSHQEKTVTLVAQNTQKETAAIVKDIEKRWYAPPKAHRGPKSRPEFKPLLEPKDYEKAFHSIQADLYKGRCYQVNYTQAFQAAYQGDSWGLYTAIRKANPVPFSAFLQYEYADILSFSPERFMLYDKGHLLASPIKGTKRRSEDKNIDAQLRAELRSCSKNRTENVMIVDLMRNDFGKIAKAGTVRVPALCTVESFAAVHHLVSHIEAECLDHLGPLEAFFSCFPGGSITGAPKHEAMQAIDEVEPFSRGLYCGSIGYLSCHGRLDMNIAIRTITATADRLHLAAGGALVYDSICAEEQAECWIKIAGILKGLH